MKAVKEEQTIAIEYYKCDIPGCKYRTNYKTEAEKHDALKHSFTKSKVLPDDIKVFYFETVGKASDFFKMSYVSRAGLNGAGWYAYWSDDDSYYMTTVDRYIRELNLEIEELQAKIIATQRIIKNVSEAVRDK